MDADLAKAWADTFDPDDTAEKPVTPHGYSLQVKLLVTLVNHIKRLEAVLLAVHGNTPSPMAPIPLPTNALEIELLRRDDAVVDEVLTRLGAE
ncbi:hypothetical protein IU500_12435 [Nocardia terpenica]|uniref:hypothetical protein n=1 Tax=Nocardia terpenica TaxID=455432 RepID=UPI001893FE74|nr:hypothetical protein [Nocardia terpenica]MBF6063015.1 hypothetical protein [Nocardia terpenica]MBF6104850.1 hypothetical protein [Nocardia terpenica]MBF6112713.1 hypothetical protein [Nocardia terpenica]MBF6118578.1 hypothetical protein [Nocardia terpenica]MBF6155057.1 hypothetical protein [Nocardia terpenica]